MEYGSRRCPLVACFETYCKTTQFITRPTGGQGVAGSSPVSPPKELAGKDGFGAIRDRLNCFRCRCTPTGTSTLRRSTAPTSRGPQSRSAHVTDSILDFTTAPRLTDQQQSRCWLCGGCERSPCFAWVIHVIAEASEMASAGNDCSRIGSLATDPWTPRGKVAIDDMGVDGDHSVDTRRSAENLDSGCRGVGSQDGRHGGNRARGCSKQQQT